MQEVALRDRGPVQERQVLAGPVWPGVVWLVFGLGCLLLESSLGGLSWRSGLGAGYVVMGGLHLLSRDTVPDAVGIKPPGSVRRRVAWSEVLAVEQSKMAFSYRSIEVSVRGRRRPVMLPERGTVATSSRCRAVGRENVRRLLVRSARSSCCGRRRTSWQLVINTLTTIVTFLVVALLQNSQTRADKAIQHKLNGIADGLADLMEELGGDKPQLLQDAEELRAAVGLEHRESS